MVMDSEEMRKAAESRERIQKGGQEHTMTGTLMKERHVHQWSFSDGRAVCISPGCGAEVEMKVIDSQDPDILNLMSREAARRWNMRGRYEYGKTQREYAKDYRALAAAAKSSNPKNFIDLVKRHFGRVITVEK